MGVVADAYICINMIDGWELTSGARTTWFKEGYFVTNPGCYFVRVILLEAHSYNYALESTRLPSLTKAKRKASVCIRRMHDGF